MQPEKEIDKSWIAKPRHSIEYINGVDKFIEFALEHGGSRDGMLLCPCKYCLNNILQFPNIVRDHVVISGMKNGYIHWNFHGEIDMRLDAQTHVGRVDQSNKNSDDEQDHMKDLVYDAFGIRQRVESEKTNEGVRNAHIDINVDDNIVVQSQNISQSEPNADHLRFLKFVEEGNQELYPGSNSTVLSFTVKLMHLKCDNEWSKKSVDQLLEFWKNVYPDSRIPKSYDEAKKMTKSLGLSYEKIHVCPNKCMLFRGDKSSLDSCNVCGESRWKKENEGGENSKKKKIPVKILRYFPLIKRLQRLYVSKKTSSSMRWHEEGRTKDGLLRHPADSQSWKDFDNKYPDFASDSRNIRLGLASDGFNPFADSNNPYSIWPVILIPYNLPPWLCMKQTSFILSMLIPGKDSPGDKIDIFLQPLIDELLQLWDGVETYDATSNEMFLMRAALIWTLNDFPAYAYLSGWSTKGTYACPCCADQTESKWLKHGGKFCYLGHRRWLGDSHKFRTQPQFFDGTEEWRNAPTTLSGSDALRQLERVNFMDEHTSSTSNEATTSRRKRPRITRTDSYDLDEEYEDDVGSSDSILWKKKSVFFKLPYWEFNTLRHNLDVMHIEKNVCDNVIATFLNIKGKSKDNSKSRQDLVEMGIRRQLHPVEQPNGKFFFPPACYSMTRTEKDMFLKVLHHVRMPDSYASNISRGINVKERKLQSLKTHDYHILMQDLLPVALRTSMTKQVTKLIIELSSIFKAICSKTINVEDMDTVKSRSILLLCHMERCFPPSFFTIMVHLIIHLADEVKLGGPVQFRWMYPIERCWRVFKKYMGNKAHPEGSIAETYITQEALTFCSRYLDGIETVFNRPRRNYDVNPKEGDIYLFPSGGRGMGAPIYKILDRISLGQGHRYVLSHVEEVQPFVELFKSYKIEKYRPRRYNSSTLQRLVAEEFHSWFKTHVEEIGYGNVSDKIRWLSIGPFAAVTSYKGYVCNGYRFHTKEANHGKRTQNFGVALTSTTPSVASVRDPNLIEGEVEYFGELTDIIELEYTGQLKVVLFRCNWADVTHGRGVKKDEFGFTLVNFSRLSHTGQRMTDEPFVISSQVQQVFYVQDPLNTEWQVVIKTVPRDLFDIGEDIGLDLEDNDDEEEDDDYVSARSEPYVRQDLEEGDWLRHDVNDDLFNDFVHQTF